MCRGPIILGQIFAVSYTVKNCKFTICLQYIDRKFTRLRIVKIILYFLGKITLIHGQNTKIIEK